MRESSSDFPAGVRKPISRAPSLKGLGGCRGAQHAGAPGTGDTGGPRWWALLVAASNLELSAVSHGMSGCPMGCLGGPGEQLRSGSSSTARASCCLILVLAPTRF